MRQRWLGEGRVDIRVLYPQIRQNMLKTLTALSEKGLHLCAPWPRRRDGDGGEGGEEEQQEQQRKHHLLLPNVALQ